MEHIFSAHSYSTLKSNAFLRPLTKMKVVVFLCVALHVFLDVPATLGQTCGWDPESYYIYVDEDHPLDTPFMSGEAFNVAFVHVDVNYMRAKKRVENGTQFIDLYPTETLSDRGDLSDNSATNAEIYLRCFDSSTVTKEMRIYAVDTNNRAPEFSEDSYALKAELPWPIEIPISISQPIFVSDLDYMPVNALVSVTTESVNLVRVTTTNLTKFGNSYQYKVDIFAASTLFPGMHTIQLSATDGVHVTTCLVSLVVTEATCRTHLRDPVFGNKAEATPVLILYKAVLNFVPKINDILRLEGGAKVEAFDPDDLCKVVLSLDADFLEIMANGEIQFTRELSTEEMNSMDKITVIEIKATEEVGGTFTRIPLIINVQF